MAVKRMLVRPTTMSLMLIRWYTRRPHRASLRGQRSAVALVLCVLICVLYDVICIFICTDMVWTLCSLSLRYAMKLRIPSSNEHPKNGKRQDCNSYISKNFCRVQ